MTPLHQRIVTLLIVAGPGGMSGDDIFKIVYDGRLPRYRGSRHNVDRNRWALKANVWRINKELQPKGYRINGTHARGGWYRYEKLL